MAWVATAVVGANLVGGYFGNKAQADAAGDAAYAQVEAARLGIEEQRRQFDALQAVLKPYVDAGAGSLIGYQDLLGVNGADKQQLAINGIAASPEMQAMQQQGEEAILANASATGGLRGGNTQAALAQFRPQLLSQLINQQFGRLGGLVGIGQNSAAGVGNAGMSMANNIATLRSDQGAAQAGNALAQGKYSAGNINSLTQGFGQMIGILGF